MVHCALFIAMNHELRTMNYEHPGVFPATENRYSFLLLFSDKGYDFTRMQPR